MDHRESLPVWKIPEDGPYNVSDIRLRLAHKNDISRLVEYYARAISDLDFYTHRQEAYWLYLLEAARFPIHMVVNSQTGESVGYVILILSENKATILESDLLGSADCMGLLQYLKREGSQQVLVSGSPYTPLAQLAHSLGSQVVGSTQWLLRIPDIPRFFMRLQPVIEKRLVDSPWRGLTAELVVNLYRQAYRLRFIKGSLEGVDPLGFVDASMGADGGHLCLPPDAFVRLVTGYRRLDELFDAWPDIVVKPDVRNLIDVLFPPVRSYLYMPYHYMGSRGGGL
jgi:hypothetical protein